MAEVDVPLPDHMKEFVESQASKLGFATVSAYLESLLREVQIQEARKVLENLIREGLESGPAAPLTSEEWDSIGREGMELARSRRGQDGVDRRSAGHPNE